MPPKRKSRTLVRSIAVKAQDFHLEYLATLPRGAARNHEGKVEALSYLIRQFATEEEARESRSLSNDEAAKLVVQLVMAARQSSLRAVKFAQLSVLKLPFSKDNLYEKRSSPLYGVPESVLNDAGRTLLIPHFNGTHIEKARRIKEAVTAFAADRNVSIKYGSDAAEGVATSASDGEAQASANGAVNCIANASVAMDGVAPRAADVDVVAGAAANFHGREDADESEEDDDDDDDESEDDDDDDDDESEDDDDDDDMNGEMKDDNEDDEEGGEDVMHDDEPEESDVDGVEALYSISGRDGMFQSILPTKGDYVYPDVALSEIRDDLARGVVGTDAKLFVVDDATDVRRPFKKRLKVVGRGGLKLYVMLGEGVPTSVSSVLSQIPGLSGEPVQSLPQPPVLNNKRKRTTVTLSTAVTRHGLWKTALEENKIGVGVETLAKEQATLHPNPYWVGGQMMSRYHDLVELTIAAAGVLRKDAVSLKSNACKWDLDAKLDTNWLVNQLSPELKSLRRAAQNGKPTKERIKVNSLTDVRAVLKMFKSKEIVKKAKQVMVA